MKKIWLLYFLFIGIFCFGDIISTVLVLQFKQPITIPETCVCKLPPECEQNPIVSRSPTWLGILLPKIAIAVAMLSLIIFIKSPIVYFALLMFCLLGIFGVATNLSIYYWKLNFFLGYIVAVVSTLMLYLFTKKRT